MGGSEIESASFGPFRLLPNLRVLEKNGVAIQIGDRALDILCVLVGQAGQVVSQKELNARVWRDLVVTPGNLRVHMSALRKVLGDGNGGVRYIENVTGQGYCFVAPVSRGTVSAAQQIDEARLPDLERRAARQRTLPPALARMVGRDNNLSEVAAAVRVHRLVTIVGPGGIGKTTLAIALSHSLFEEFESGVLFVDLSSIADPTLVPATVGSMLGLAIQSADPMSTLMASLRDQHLLLVLDNCEHLVSTASVLAEAIQAHAPQVHVLATSREALRAEGEHVMLLPGLDCPAADVPLNSASAMTFPAIRLFAERAAERDHCFALTDANAARVADLCRRLDGIALAIEFVAARTATYGLEGTATMLDRQLGLSWPGRRTAPARHQTLQALLQWSYDLLCEDDQRVLRSLAVFAAPFSFRDAQVVAGLDSCQLDARLGTLIEKSLVSVIHRQDGSLRFRLLETTRLFAMDRLESSGDRDATFQRHARHLVWIMKSGSSERRDYIGCLRRDLAWFLEERDTEPFDDRIQLGVELAASSASFLLELSLWAEVLRWSKRALACFSGSTGEDEREMILQEAYAIAALFSGAEGIREALVRALEISRRLGATSARLRLLASLHFYSHRTVDFKASLAYSEEMRDVARSTDNPSSWVIAEWLQGSSLYAMGDQTGALDALNRAFSHPVSASITTNHLGISFRSRGLIGLARVRWLRGFPDQAHLAARLAIQDLERTAPVNQSYALLISCHVFIWCGDLAKAQEVVDAVTRLPQWNGRLVWFHAEAQALRGELLFRRGEALQSIELLRGALLDMKATSPKNLMRTTTACCLGEALAATGKFEEALAVLDDALAPTPEGHETWETAELLRVRAEILMGMPHREFSAAERYLERSITCSRRQGSRAWELRATNTLARLLQLQGTRSRAHQLLRDIYRQYEEGFSTPDLVAATALLKELEAQSKL